MDCLCLWKGGGSERGWGSWGMLVDMEWDEEFRVVLFMALMGVRGCSGTLGLEVGGASAVGLWLFEACGEVSIRVALFGVYGVWLHVGVA